MNIQEMQIAKPLFWDEWVYFEIFSLITSNFYDCHAYEGGAKLSWSEGGFCLKTCVL